MNLNSNIRDDAGTTRLGNSLHDARPPRADARGIAVVRNIPPGESDDNSSPHAVSFDVSFTGHMPTRRLLEPPTEGVVLVVGQTAHVTVHLKRQ
jgi:hypothetical protein